MIDIDQLTWTLRGRTILDHVSFRAAPRRVTGFVGPNGAGKSSTLRVLLGLQTPTSGEATISKRRYRDFGRPLDHIGASLGGAGAHPSRRAVDHLGWVAATHGYGRARVHEVLEQVGLAHAAKARVRTFSLGMAQRLGIATALLGDPEVLVLDEPINGLDPEGIRWIRTLVRRRADDGGTVLLSSHVMAELATVADDLVVISGGRVRASGTVSEVVAGHGGLEEAFFALTTEEGR